MEERPRLLDGEAPPVVLVNGDGRFPVLLVCEHAGRTIPRRLGGLGLPASDLERHIAWDIGAEAVARGMASALDAPLVLQRYSRLVYDCNRPPESPGAMPEISETTVIPGNLGLDGGQREARIREIYEPFHAEVARRLDAMTAAGKDPVLVTVHSFTPVYKGDRRDVEIGILHDRDARFADRLLDALAEDGGLDVRRNEPYGPQDGVTHTLVLHALPRGLRNVMIEVRNELIAGAEGQRAMAALLAERIGQAMGRSAAPRAALAGGAG